MRFRLSVLMFLQWAVPGAVVPLYTVRLEQTPGFDALTVGACCATQAAATACSALVAGQVADRWLSAEKALSACAATAGLALWLLAEARQPAAVFGLTLLFWCATGPALLLGTTICFTHLPEPARQFGPVRLWGTAGWMVIGWLLAAWLAGPWGHLDDTCRLGALLALALAGYAWALPATPPGPVRDGSRRLAPLAAARLLRHRAFACYLVCLLGACLTFPFSVQLTPLLLRQRDLPEAGISALLTLGQSSEVACLFLLPLLLQRLGVRGTLGLGLGAWVAALAALAVGWLGLVIGSLGLSGLFVTGFLSAGQVHLNSVADDDLRASVQGLYTFVNGVGQLAGNLLAGWLRGRAPEHLSAAFILPAVVTGLMFVLFLAGFRPGEKPAEPA